MLPLNSSVRCNRMAFRKWKTAISGGWLPFMEMDIRRWDRYGVWRNLPYAAQPYTLSCRRGSAWHWGQYSTNVLVTQRTVVIKRAYEFLGRSRLQLPRLPNWNTSRVKILTKNNLSGYLKNNLSLSVNPFNIRIWMLTIYTSSCERKKNLFASKSFRAFIAWASLAANRFRQNSNQK